MTDWKQLGPVALVFIVAMLVLTFGAMVTQEVRDESSFTTSVNTGNDTQAGAASVQLNYTDITVGSLSVYNASGTVLVPANNYTLDAVVGIVTLDAKWQTSTALTFNYNRNVRSEAYMAAGNATSGITKMAKYGPLFALMLIAALLVGTVLTAFRRK